jgi:hypothetical protein
MPVSPAPGGISNSTSIVHLDALYKKFFPANNVRAGALTARADPSEVSNFKILGAVSASCRYRDSADGEFGRFRRGSSAQYADVKADALLGDPGHLPDDKVDCGYLRSARLLGMLQSDVKDILGYRQFMHSQGCLSAGSLSGERSAQALGHRSGAP